MRRTLMRVAFVGLSFVTLLLESGTAIAAPAAPTKGTTITTNGAEILYISAAECAEIRAAVAGTKYATDPQLCTFIPWMDKDRYD